MTEEWNDTAKMQESINTLSWWLKELGGDPDYEIRNNQDDQVGQVLLLVRSINRIWPYKLVRASR